MDYKRKQDLKNHFWEFHRDALGQGDKSRLLDFHGVFYKFIHTPHDRESFMFKCEDIVFRT